MKKTLLPILSLALLQLVPQLPAQNGIVILPDNAKNPKDRFER
jgi:hypothetical protein